MKNIRASALALAVTAVTGLAGASAAQAAPKDPFINIAHRGASGHLPEHTFAAYDLALKMGADYIEQDLQETKDGELVVLHDGTLDRTTDCTGRVKDRTLAEIKQCDAGNGQEVPTLGEVFERYGHRVNYYIETKATGIGERLLEVLDEYHLRQPAVNRWQVLIQSFSTDTLQQIHAIDPELPLIQLGLTRAQLLANMPQIAEYAVGIGPSYGEVDANVVAAAHDVCMDVHPYTVDRPADMQALIDAGVDGMFTNFPDRLETLLGDDALPGPTAGILSAHAHKDCVRG